MKKLNSAGRNQVTRAAAFLLCLVLASTCFWTGFVTIFKWDDLWLGGDYYQSTTAERDATQEYYRLRSLLDLKQTELWNGDLTYSEREQMEALEATFAAENTNFRFQVHDQDGIPMLNNLGGGVLEVPVRYMRRNTFEQDDNLQNKDYLAYDEARGVALMMVYTGEGYVACDPGEYRHERHNDYGWLASESGTEWDLYSSMYDTRVRKRELVVEYGITSPMVVDDNYSNSKDSFERMQAFLPAIAAAFLLTLLATLALLVFLCSAAGRQEDGTVAPGPMDRIPYDLYLLLDLCVYTVLLAGGDALTYGSGIGLNRLLVIGLGIFTLLFATVTLALLLTTAVRLKTHTLWRRSLIGRMFCAIGRFFGGIGRNWSITRRAVWLFFLYLMGTVLTTITVVLIPVYQGFVLWLVCRWVRQWKALRAGTERIVGGDPEFRINTTGMYRDLKEHAAQLNDLGGAIGSAVDEQLRSERFKAELITNVSHDLKTPLTSIINYVGLLKTVPMENPQALEYIDVLDRKSQRLKKLTEDLVDASKASTGNLTVNLERLGMGQLVEQALGEYEDKFADKALEVVFAPPAEELYVWADGRHLWRVIDNLFSNCAKYALERTRIYLDLRRWDGNIFLSVKNISRQALNVPPEQLMERFVRGEEARTTEGSGLGLSIARSLTELQHGSFRLDVDGDLFKASVAFPEAVALPERSTSISDEIA